MFIDCVGQEFKKVRAGTVCSIASGTSARTIGRLRVTSYQGQEAFGGLFTHEFSRQCSYKLAFGQNITSIHGLST